MINGYMSIKEVADKWNISPRRVRVLCETGRIDGAAKLGREWAIPENVERPIDKRVTTGEYKDREKEK